MKRRQRGVALISIMLIVVIATVLAVQMTSEQSLMIQRTASRLDATQARQYALGGEELARQILWRDFEENPVIDHLAEDWAAPGLRFEFDNGAVELRITDLQGRINLNSLASPTPGGEPPVEQPGTSPQEPGGVSDPAAVLTRLMGHIGADPMYAERIRDWVDADDGKGALGAEDFDYLGLERPYRAADRPMASTSELRLILEMEPQLVAALAPHVAALPESGVPINVNTASPLVLASLVPTLTVEAAEALASSRDSNGPWETATSFLQDPALAGSGLGASGIGVQSGFFEVSVRAQFLERFAYLTSIIQRNPADGSMRVIFRDMSTSIVPLAPEAADG